MEEIWQKVPDYNNYSVSNLGRVRNDKTFRILKGGLNLDGYNNNPIAKNGKYKTFRTHQLVAIVFLNHIPNGHKLVINHINGIKTDNRVENLEIVTNRENTSTCYNPNKVKCSSQYIGVYWNKQMQKWKCQIVINKKKIFLGSYNSEIMASKIYNDALLNLTNGTFEEWENNLITNNKTSKYKGIYFDKSKNMWIATVTMNKKTKNIGGYKDEESAVTARENFLKINNL